MQFWLDILEVIAIMTLIWCLFAIIIPAIYLPNFLFKERIETNKEIAKIAKKIKKPTKTKTLQEAYHFVNRHFEDYEKEFDLKHLDRFYELFELHNYKVKRLLRFHNKKFMWCYAQVKVLLSLLKNTGKFKESDLKVKMTLSPHFTIHQYAIIKIGNKKIKVDPFYRIFREVH